VRLLGKVISSPFLKSCFKNLPEEIASFSPDFKYIFVDLSYYTDEEITDKIFTQRKYIFNI